MDQAQQILTDMEADLSDGTPLWAGHAAHVCGLVPVEEDDVDLRVLDSLDDPQDESADTGPFLGVRDLSETGIAQICGVYVPKEPDAEDDAAALKGIDEHVARVENAGRSRARKGKKRPRAKDPLTKVRPHEVVQFVNSILRKDWSRAELFRRVEEVLLGNVLDPHKDPAAVEAVWRYAYAPQRRGELLRWIRREADKIVHVAHGVLLSNRERRNQDAGLPAYLLRSQPVVTKEFSVIEVKEGPLAQENIGYAPYMEQTPAEVIRHDLRVWMDKYGKSEGTPEVWDLTGGSGTSIDVLTGGFGIAVQATDLNNATEDVAFGDAREVGAFLRLLGASRIPGIEGRTVKRPNLVLFDPPSRGGPTHAEVYHGGHPTRDLGRLDRDGYLDALVEVTAGTFRVLKNAGLMSILIRCSVRNQQEVVADETLADDYLALLLERMADLQVVERLNVRWAKSHRVQQAGVGKSRPTLAVRFMLGRAA